MADPTSTKAGRIRRFWAGWSVTTPSGHSDVGPSERSALLPLRQVTALELIAMARTARKDAAGEPRT